MNLEEASRNIIQIVKEHSDQGGITKNEAVRKLSHDFGGSRSTYWKCFEYLLDPNGSKKIEARIVPPNKQRELLFSTEEYGRLEFLKKQLLEVDKFLEFVQNDPLVGDVYYPDSVDRKKLLKIIPLEDDLSDPVGRPLIETLFVDSKTGFNPDSLSKTSQSVLWHQIEKKDDMVDTICTLQARHDILEKLPFFLINHIKKQNSFSKVTKNEGLGMVSKYSIICSELLQKNYLYSPYYSEKFAKQLKRTTQVFLEKGIYTSDIEIDFLKTLGRYYFLISLKYSSDLKIDSSKEQIKISKFVQSFYSSNIQNNDLTTKSIGRNEKAKKDLEILDEDFHEYLTGLGPFDYIEEDTLKTLKKIDKSFGGRFIRKFKLNLQSDPIEVTYYYAEWLFKLGIFSTLEQKMIDLTILHAEIHIEE